jgi:hypothetical protein
MMRYPSNTVQQTPLSSSYNADPVLVNAQPVRDIENARAAPPVVNLVGPHQTALIYISDRPLNSSIMEMQGMRPAPTAPRAESPSPQAQFHAPQAEPAEGGISAREFKLFAGFLGGCAVIGAGAAAYKKWST